MNENENVDTKIYFEMVNFHVGQNLSCTFCSLDISCAKDPEYMDSHNVVFSYLLKKN